MPLIRIPRLVTGESISEQEAKDIIAKIDSNSDDGVTKAELLAYGEVREAMAYYVAVCFVHLTLVLTLVY